MAGVKTIEKMFRDVERVIYGKPPLVEVVCQARFPADLRIEKEPPADFQQRVRGRFPILNRTIQSVASGFPPELARAIETMIPPGATVTTWQFSTEDGLNQLQLATDKLTLVTRNYTRWEHFFPAFGDSLVAIQDIYRPPFLNRIGLRYKDLIRRSTLELDDTPWHELLASHVLGELAVEGVREHAKEASRNLLLTLPEREAKVRITHGFAEADGSKEQCYLIDCDFFVDRTDIQNAPDTIEYLHLHARKYFRWCISDGLHRAMEPRPMPC